MNSHRISAAEVIAHVADPGTFRSWDAEPLAVAADPDYAEALRRARERSGVDESVLSGECLIGGVRVCVIACEFAFLGGSIGVAAAERITLAIERATAEGLPLIASPTSGGTRMQEGTIAFLQMVKIAAAVEIHKAAHLPYLVYLRDPTTGGVFASWGSLGHITLAQPGALIGFLGPRVYEALHGVQFPAGVQTAENLHAHGVIDAVLEPQDLRGTLIRVLTVLAPAGPRPADEEPAQPADIPAWQSVLASRRPDRPGVRELLETATDLVLLGGGPILLALARFHGQPAVVLGQDRASLQPLGPGALREARRGMRLARELALPLVLVIDTAGAELSAEAEDGGLAPEIARCVAELVTLRTPTVALLLGQGTGGGALAMLPADRVLCAQHGWLAPLPPEGASAIMHRDTAHAPQMAAAQGIRSLDLLRGGIVDAVVPELPDDAAEPAQFCARAATAIAHELAGLADAGQDARIATRMDRYRRLGLG